ncbi:MAG: squalene-associated FAD-dependent desaturase [Planctomycetota bacterium]
MAKNPVVVVGGGMAGVAAALKLIEFGESVVLLEKKASLGGRATSFVEPTTGDEIDNGQHVLLGCCTNVIDLLKTIGTDSLIEWSDSFTYVEPNSKRHLFAPTFLPAPLHFTPALLSFGALSFGQRLEVSRAFLAMMFASEKTHKRWATQPMLPWLKEQKQSERTIARFWRPIVIGAVNEDLDIAATTPSLQVFLEGFLPHRKAANLGVAKVGLEKLYASPAAAFIEEAKSSVRSKTKVAELLVDGNKLTGVRLQNGEVIQTDRCVLALPPESLSQLVCSDQEPILSSSLLSQFKHAPIAGLHFWFDRETLDVDHAALLDTELEWVFKKSPPGPKAQALGARERLQGVISAAHHLHGRSQEEIIESAVRELKAAFPAYEDSRLVHGVVVRENRATLSMDPASNENRPDHLTRIEGCVLAGDWVQTGWPATLEGATRAGRRAAALLTGHTFEEALTSDLKRNLLTRILLARVPSPLVKIHDPGQ